MKDQKSKSVRAGIDIIISVILTYQFIFWFGNQDSQISVLTSALSFIMVGVYNKYKYDNWLCYFQLTIAAVILYSYFAPTLLNNRI